MSYAAAVVRQTRRMLLSVLVMRAFLVVAGVAAGGLLVATLAGVVPRGAATVRDVVLGATLLLVVVMGLLWWRRATAAREPRRVALWLEERCTALRYALVTLVESGSDVAWRDALDDMVRDAVPPDALTRIHRAAAWRALRGPGAFIVLVLALLAFAPAASVMRAITHGRPNTSGAPSRDRSASSLAMLVARVHPPAYLAAHDSVIEQPTFVRAPAGSVIDVAGTLGATPVDSARFGSVAIGTMANETQWRASLRLTSAGVLRLYSGGDSRAIGLEPIADAAPVVELVMPAHDTVLPAAHGVLPILARAADDHGLAELHVDIIISSGEGESFKFRSATLGARATTALRDSTRVSLSLDSLALSPGDLVHVRAAARDRDDAPSANVGASDTRVIRIERVGERDSVVVDAAPPPEAQSVLSERMLILQAEALERRRSALTRATVLSESQRIARDQAQLRREVSSLIFARADASDEGEESRDAGTAGSRDAAAVLRAAEAATDRAATAIDFEGGESPVVAVNRPLLEAYEAMWDAGRELEQGAPARALPAMHRALDAIERARAAERLYLRGASSAGVVNVHAVRMTGKERGASSTRQAGEPIDPARASIAARLDAIARLGEREPSAAGDSLLLVRVELLGSDSVAADQALAASNALRAGRLRAARIALRGLRAQLVGAARALPSVPWSIAP